MKDKQVNKILKPQDIAEEKEATTESETVDNEQNQDGEQKREMPPVKPSTIILMCLFALLFAAVYFFSPYIMQYLPFGGKTVSKDLGIREVSYSYLVQNCHSVVIGKSVQTRTSVGEQNQELVYTEHLFEISQVLYGNPIMEDEKHLITYSLGGTLNVPDHLGRPQKINYKFNDAAELGSDTVLLFLDDNNNIINEKYGLFKKQNDTAFYDTRGTIYTVESIKKALAEAKAE